MSDIALLSCPFCGSGAAISHCEEGCCGAQPREVFCTNKSCGLANGFYVQAKDDADAAKLWNTRTAAAALGELVSLVKETRLDEEYDNDCVEGRLCQWCERADAALAKAEAVLEGKDGN